MTKGDNKEDKGKDKKGEEWPPVRILVFGVIALGLVLIGISIFLKYPELHYIIRGLGISIIGGAFIAWAIGHLISKGKFQKLFENMEELYGRIIATDENINKNIENRFDLIKECEANGLLKIYEPFDIKFKCQGTNRLASKDFTEEVKNMLDTEENEIKICGLSLRLFFNSDHGKFFSDIRNAFLRMGNTGKPIVKILMLYPESDWKVLRQSVEDKYTTPGQKLETNLDESIAWLDENIEHSDEIKNKDKIMDNIRFYDATPDFFLFITSQCIIFEIYHMGAFQLEKERNRDLYCLGLGGHVPVFKFDNQSPMYNYLSAHFDYYFEKEIDGKPNKYHKGTLKEWLAKAGSIKEAIQE